VTATLIDASAGRACARSGPPRSPSSATWDSATVLVGDDPASHIYIELKQKAATAAGWTPHLKLPGDTSEEDLLATIAELNSDARRRPARPAPAARPHRRDVRDRGDRACEGRRRHPSGERRPVYLGRPTLVPGTPLGIMRMLDEYEIPLEGARAVVVGVPRSSQADGALLLQRNATVTICHFRARRISNGTRSTRRPRRSRRRTHLISADRSSGRDGHRRRMNRDESSRKVLGDVDRER